MEKFACDEHVIEKFKEAADYRYCMLAGFSECDCCS